jgi:hypothetical protein
MAEINESSSEHGVRSRGNVLAMLGGAVGGALAGALAEPGRALGGHDGTDIMHLGVVNHTPDGLWTGLNANVDREAFGLQNFGTGGGIHAQVRGGGALVGNMVSADPHLAALSGNSSLEEGQAAYGKGVGTGVAGQSGSGTGVSGHSDSGNGVAGGSDTGVGTSGDSAMGIGVHAVSENGQALRVEGRAVFSTAGSGTVPQGQNSVLVANSAVTAASHITVTLVSNPGLRSLHWVQPSPGSGFTVRLTQASTSQRPATAFTYLIVGATA